MSKEDKLLNHYGRQTGMKVPDGYFEDFASRMQSRLPAYPEKPRPQILTTWQRIKPYVYLAAMFAGIWCMMKMFHIASENASTMSLDNPPQTIVAAIEKSDPTELFIDDSYDSYDLSDYELEHEISGAYENIDQFEEDFGYVLSPEYASMEVPETIRENTSDKHTLSMT